MKSRHCVLRSTGMRSTAAWLLALLLSPAVLRADQPAAPMNFVFFLVDDLGWADVGAFGSTFYETPGIDALAASGMRFTQGYAACPVCSPTRASILTGRHPVRVGITDWIPGNQPDPAMNPRFQQVHDRNELALEETTVAEVLRDAGYQTFFAGKWHLGGEGWLPTDQGFQFNKGGFHAGSPPGGYYAPWKNPYLPEQRPGEYLTERLTEECVAFLKGRQPKQPFFLYLSYYNVHTPIQPYQKRYPHFVAKADQLFADEAAPLEERRGVSRSRQDNPEYASMVAAVDDSVTSILQTLEQLQLTDNTAVIFFSDNGGLCTLRRPAPTSNLPLRSGKGWLYEGGIREPLIVRVPQLTRPGSVCTHPVVSMDFFPTILELAGLPARPDLAADGLSLVPLLRGEPALPHRQLVWHYPHYHGSLWTPGAAVRDGDWKLIEFYEFGDAELYNLQDDPGERQNLAAAEPRKLAELRSQLSRWQHQMQASLPQPNPDYDPSRPLRPR